MGFLCLYFSLFRDGVDGWKCVFLYVDCRVFVGVAAVCFSSVLVLGVSGGYGKVTSPAAEIVCSWVLFFVQALRYPAMGFGRRSGQRVQCSFSSVGGPAAYGVLGVVVFAVWVFRCLLGLSLSSGLLVSFLRGGLSVRPVCRVVDRFFKQFR